MLVTMKEILDKANAENYAVAAPNVWSELDARAVISAAQQMNAPLIIDIADIANPDLVLLGRICEYLANKVAIPIAIHLDHGTNKTQIMQAIKGGFTSVMYDCSDKDFETNIKEVKEIVEFAHALNITVEAELGHVGQANDYSHDYLTDPNLAREFIERTQVDCLAVAIGTAHGAYSPNVYPQLDFERLVKIKKATNHFPLVMHGSSGTDNDSLQKACRLGINKVNIANDLCKAAVYACQHTDLTGNNAYRITEIIEKAIEEKLKEMIKIYGSQNKA